MMVSSGWLLPVLVTLTLLALESAKLLYTYWQLPSGMLKL